MVRSILASVDSGQHNYCALVPIVYAPCLILWDTPEMSPYVIDLLDLKKSCLVPVTLP